MKGFSQIKLVISGHHIRSLWRTPNELSLAVVFQDLVDATGCLPNIFQCTFSLCSFPHFAQNINHHIDPPIRHTTLIILVPSGNHDRHSLSGIYRIRRGTNEFASSFFSLSFREIHVASFTCEFACVSKEPAVPKIMGDHCDLRSYLTLFNGRERSS
jgi:hypothetical protein